jgi:acetyltransferase-like isoleucine patch superfamily enzyme
MVDLISKIIIKQNELKQSFFSFFSTKYMRLFCLISGIYVSRRTRFFGLTKFLRQSNSEIYIGKNCTFRSKSTSNLIGINHKCIIVTHAKGAVLKIADNCGFSGTTIGCFKEIIIGNNVKCGANTLITDSDWHLNDPRVGEPRPIFINDNVWLGYGVIVMKGVTIGENSIIGAGSVVTKSIPANVIAGGNPCVVIKTIK